jgi:hypothetical protein
MDWQAQRKGSRQEVPRRGREDLHLGGGGVQSRDGDGFEAMCARADRGRWRGTTVKSKKDWIDGWVVIVKKEK